MVQVYVCTCPIRDFRRAVNSLHPSFSIDTAWPKPRPAEEDDAGQSTGRVDRPRACRAIFPSRNTRTLVFVCPCRASFPSRNTRTLVFVCPRGSRKPAQHAYAQRAQRARAPSCCYPSRNTRAFNIHICVVYREFFPLFGYLATQAPAWLCMCPCVHAYVMCVVCSHHSRYLHRCVFSLFAVPVAGASRGRGLQRVHGSRVARSQRRPVAHSHVRRGEKQRC